MSEGMNKVIMLGNLGDDPELRSTQGGQDVLNFRMACTTVYFDKDGEKKESTEWARIVVWGNRATSLDKLLSKGSRVLVEGRLQTSSYDDKDGVKRYVTDVVATNVVLCDGAKRSGGHEADPDEGEPERPRPAVRDDRRERAPAGNGRDRDRGRGRDDDRRSSGGNYGGYDR